MMPNAVRSIVMPDPRCGQILPKMEPVALVYTPGLSEGSLIIYDIL